MLKQLSILIGFLLFCGVTIGCFDSTTTAPEPMEQTSISDSLFVALQDSILNTIASDQPAQDSLHQLEIDRVTFYYDSLMKALPQPVTTPDADTVPPLNIDSILSAQQHALDSIAHFYSTTQSAQFEADADSLLSHFTDSLNQVHTEQQQLVLDSLHASQTAHLDSLKAEYNSAVDSITKENGSNSVDSLTLAQEHALDSLNVLFAAEVDSMKSTVYDSIYNDVVVKSASQYIQVNYASPRKSILTFLYPYYDSAYSARPENGNLLSASISNRNYSESFTVITTAEVVGITRSSSQTIVIDPRTTETFELNPELINENLPQLLATRTEQVNVIIKVIKNGGETTIHSESFDIEVIPPNSYTAGVTIPNPPPQPSDTLHFENYLATWVQYWLPEIDSLKSEAAQLHPDGTLVGYQTPGNTTPTKSIARNQVKAIYEALQARDIAYIDNTFSPNTTQSIKYPNQTLKTKAANCIDGTVLFAAALEDIGLEPVIMLLPSHSIVGWRTWTNNSEIEYIETTYTWSSNKTSFEDALAKGKTQSERDTTEIIDVYNLHKSGINALSVEMP
ncbi:MAG: hypothetical protein OCC49_05705 [Fibrobacterales bacterium]